MKATNRLATIAVIGALTIGAAGNLRGDDVEGKARVGGVEGKASLDIKKDKDTIRTETTDRYTAENRSERNTGVSDAHKASSIVGMKVKNHAGETLGDVQDLVIDLKSGKISYAVLAVGGFLGIGEKYIAVPPSAFEVGSDEKNLVLNADKARLESAPGFVKTNWPDYRNPDLNAFWTTDRDVNVGGSTTITTGSDKSSSSRDLNKKYDSKTDRDLQKNSSDRLNK